MIIRLPKDRHGIHLESWGWLEHRRELLSPVEWYCTAHLETIQILLQFKYSTTIQIQYIQQFKYL
jgi:hypothetical protein